MGLKDESEHYTVTRLLALTFIIMNIHFEREKQAQQCKRYLV